MFIFPGVELHIYLYFGGFEKRSVNIAHFPSRHERTVLYPRLQMWVKTSVHLIVQKLRTLQLFPARQVSSPTPSVRPPPPLFRSFSAFPCSLEPTSLAALKRSTYSHLLKVVWCSLSGVASQAVCNRLSVFLNKQTNVRRDMMQYSVTYCLFIISSPYPGLFTSWGPPGGTFEPVCVLFTSWTSQAELPKNTRSLVLPCLHYGRLLVPQGAGFPYATDSWWQAVFSN